MNLLLLLSLFLLLGLQTDALTTHTLAYIQWVPPSPATPLKGANFTPQLNQ
jgi:hypothetical protein